MPPRRFVAVFGLAILMAILLLVSLSSSPAVKAISSVHDISRKAHQAAEIISHPKIPHLYNPFGDAAHEPPEQADSHSGETKWYSDLKWMQNPFSSLITLDENRALLPPLPSRTIIYTFYDATSQKDPLALEAEHRLLLSWRRAWWAQGFKPIVLGRPEAAKHPMHAKLKELNLLPTMNADVERWLAWAHMGGGVLANWLAFPMASRHDATLSFLRHGEFRTLLNYKDLHGGLLAGQVDQINKAIERALGSDTLKRASYMLETLTQRDFNTTSGHEGVAYYDLPTVTSFYPVVANQLSVSQAAGLHLLEQLINAHLHITWQNNFPNGIAVLQPFAQQTTAIVAHAARLAHDLIQCPSSPMVSSCPPNRPDCKICASYNSKLALSTPETLQNATKTFTIGTIPHPYTFISLIYSRDKLDSKFIRRNTLRDVWLAAVTKDLLGPIIGGPQRLPKIKDAVAGDFAVDHSVWVTAELEERMHRDWVFGFELPKNKDTHDWHGITKEADPSGARVRGMPSAEELAKEEMLLAKSKDLLRRKHKPDVEMVEAWNMADAEAWRFVRAFATRRRVERLKWEAEEKAFAGAESREQGWGAWLLGD